MRKRFLSAVTFTAVFALALFSQGRNAPARLPNPQAQLPPGTASISGNVVISGSSQPIVGATVEARRADCSSTANPPETATAFTGSDGRFSIQNIHGGGWCVVAAMANGLYAPSEYMQRNV